MAVMIAVTTALYSILIGTETIRLKWTLDEDQKKKRLRFLLILGIVMLMLAAIKLIFFFFNGEKRNMILALMSIVNGIIFIVDSSDKYVIGILIGSVAVGCYSPGYALGSILLMFLSPFAVLLPAILPEHYEKGDIEEVDKYLSYSMKYYLLLTVPAGVGAFQTIIIYHYNP